MDSVGLNDVFQKNSKKLSVVTYGHDKRKLRRSKGIVYDILGVQEYNLNAICEGVITDLFIQPSNTPKNRF
jgi:hypothetical protein